MHDNGGGVTATITSVVILVTVATILVLMDILRIHLLYMV